MPGNPLDRALAGPVSVAQKRSPAVSTVEGAKATGPSSPVPRRKPDAFTLLHDKSRQQGERLVKVDRIVVISGKWRSLQNSLR